MDNATKNYQRIHDLNPLTLFFVFGTSTIGKEPFLNRDVSKNLLSEPAVQSNNFRWLFLYHAYYTH